MSGLVPNTTYSVRAYAKNRVGSEVTKLAFGGRKEFTTQSLKAPVVSEPTYDMDVDKMTLTVSARIMDTGNRTISRAGFYYSTTHQTPDQEDTHWRKGRRRCVHCSDKRVSEESSVLYPSFCGE